MTGKRFSLVLCNKRYSSWSLRGWLALRYVLSREEFDEIFCPIAGAEAPDTRKREVREEILKFSPSGKVPALIDNNYDIIVCDSLAIALYVADTFPDATLLPSSPDAKALCISASAEMHSGFTTLRSLWPMNCMVSSIKYGTDSLSNVDLMADISRLCTLWDGLRNRFGKLSVEPYLFGSFSVADIMFAPVALRFHTYDPNLSTLTGTSKLYIEALLKCQLLQEWINDASLEGPEMLIASYEKYADI